MIIAWRRMGVSWAYLGKLLALALLYYCAARAGMLLAFVHSNASPVWPPSGLALAALILLGPRVWPGIALGAFLANVAVFAANGVAPGPATLIGTSLCIATGNTLEALSGYLLLRRWLGQTTDIALDRPNRVYALVAAAALMSLLGAAVGTGCLLLSGIVPRQAGANIFTTWWMGDTAGVLLFTPFLLAWCRPSRWPARPWRWHALLPDLLALGALAVLLALALLAFGPSLSSDHAHHALAYLLLPCIAWSAYRYRMRGVTLMMLLISGAAVVATIGGAGPFGSGTLNDALLALETFIGLSSVVGMALAADMARHGPRRPSWRQLSLHWSTLFACLCLTLAGWQLIAVGTEQRAQDRFEFEVANLSRRVRERMDAYAQVLHSAQAAYALAGHPSRAGWRQFVARIDLDRFYPGILGIGVLTYVPAPRRAEFERSVRAEGFPDYRVWPEGERDAYAPVTYLEPFSGRNLRAFGYDLLSEPVRRAAMVRAVETGQLSVSGKVLLVQEDGTAPQAGFLMFLPLLRDGAASADWQQRRAALEGYVYAAFRMNDLMAGLLGGAAPTLALEVYDGHGSSVEALMYASATAPQEGGDYANPYTRVVGVDVGDAHWTVRLTSLPAFETGVDRQKAPIVLVAGTLISLLFFNMVRALAGTRAAALSRATRMQSAYQQSEQKFAVLVDSASEFAIIASDLEGRVQVFSAGAESMLGYRAGALIGVARMTQFLLPAELLERAAQLSQAAGRQVHGAAALFESARLGRPETREWTFVRQDGGALAVQLTVSPIFGAGQLTGYLAIAYDIAERKLAEHNLRAALLRADSASRAKSDFVANMSHELRTPLNAVLGLAYLLERSPLNPGQRRDLELIRSSGRSLLGILNDILDFSKIEAGRMELAPTVFRLDDVLRALAAIMNNTARERDLDLVLDIDPDVPAQLVGDALRLQQVLVNLAGNAVKFTQRGDVVLRVRCLGRDGAQVRLRFEVRDSGIGMSDEQIGRLFVPFSQADSSTTRRFGGTGLGLVITHRLLDLMDASIAIDSVEGRGSCFQVELSLPVGPEPDPVQAARGWRLLVVDDHAGTREALARAAAALGAETVAVADADAAFAQLRRPGARFQAVLLDWHLPGRETGATIAALHALAPATPLLLMVSAHGRTVLRGDATALGADAELDKPVLAATLAECLQLGRERRGGAVAAATAPAPLRGHVLLVEDNELNQVVARGMLELIGVTLDTVADGAQAVARLREEAERYQLVLMDVQMPVLDGFGAARQIRQSLGLRLPIVALTAGVLEQERARCLAAGMDDFVAKPIDPAHLHATLARYLPAAAGQLELAHAVDDADEGFQAAGPRPSATVAGTGTGTAQSTSATGTGAGAGAGAGAATGAAQSSSAPSPSAAAFDPAMLNTIAAFDRVQFHTVCALVRQMVEAGLAPLEQARHTWQSGAPEQAARVVHGLRGSLGTLGARAFARESHRLEAALLGAAPEQAGVLFELALAEMARTIAQADAWLATLAPSDPRGAAVSAA